MTAPARTPLPKMSNEQYDRLVELREQRGWSFGRIGRAVGLPIGRVKWVCLRDGIEPPQPAPRSPVGPLVISTSSGRRMRRFTPAEDKQLERLRRSGMKPPRIALAMKRQRSSIIARLLTLARWAERAEMARHRRPPRFPDSAMRTGAAA